MNDNILYIVLLILIAVISISALIFYFVMKIRNTKKRKELGINKDGFVMPQKRKLRKYVSPVYKDKDDGEKELYETIKCLENKGLKIIPNSLYPKKDGTTSEIDMIAVSKNGIFCFENKNYHAKIVANREDERWTCIYIRGKTSYEKELYSPIKQNKAHVRYIREAIENETIPIWSIVVFPDMADIEAVRGNTPDTFLVSLGEVKELVEFLMKSNKAILSPEGVKRLYSFLVVYSEVDEKFFERHRKEVEKINLYPKKG